MLIGGWQKTSLIDYPGKVVCTIFTVGCNFYCPFCHNKDLVSQALFQKSSLPSISSEEIFSFLSSRKNILDGVCLTGGEPTLQPDLADFCGRIKKLGFLVKLDTNGSHPEIVRQLVKDNLIDFIAMDIKINRQNYSQVTKIDDDQIYQSANLILQSGLDYQFRTTLVPTMHNQENLKQLVVEMSQLAKENQIQPQDLVWHLQRFRPQNCLDKKFLSISPFSSQEFDSLVALVKNIFPNTTYQE